MTQGRFIAVVGPSGVGKDSVMEALCAARPDLYRVRRVITRAAEAGGEDYEPVSREMFQARVANGDFALHWEAHGLSYGIPSGVASRLSAGEDALANLSRGMLGAAASVFAEVHVLSITASPDVLAQRLADRGRETPADIAARLARTAPPMPQGVRVTQIDNSGALADSVAMALAKLYPAKV